MKVTALLAAAALCVAAGPGPRGDLAVATISITPRYPAYEVAVQGDVPRVLHPETRAALTPAEDAALRRRPRDGEALTATARIVNHGPGPTGPFLWQWRVDGRKASEGRHPGLGDRTRSGGPFVELTQPVRWRPRRRVELVLTPEGSDPEPANNRKTERVDALAFAAIVAAGDYNRWADAPSGSPTLSGWLQAGFDLLRERLSLSLLPDTPRGVEEAVRLDAIVVVPDAQTAEAREESARRLGWDGAWVVPAGPPTDSEEAAELRRRMLWAVEAAMDIPTPDLLRVRAVDNLVRDPLLGDRPIMGYSAAAEGDDATYPPHTVLALQRLHGLRRGLGPFLLWEMPRSTRLRILDNNGRPAAGAKVTLHRVRERRVTAADGTERVSDEMGLLTLPNLPAPPLTGPRGFALKENPFGPIAVDGSDGLFFVRVAARGASHYGWLPVTRLNVAAWSGGGASATLDFPTTIPGAGAPPPPVGLVAARTRQGVLLRWHAGTAPGPSAGYFVYRGRAPDFAWERAASVTGLRTLHLDAAPGRGEVRYAVTAVSLEGNESGHSAPVIVGLEGVGRVGRGGSITRSARRGVDRTWRSGPCTPGSPGTCRGARGAGGPGGRGRRGPLREA